MNAKLMKDLKAVDKELKSLSKKVELLISGLAEVKTAAPAKKPARKKAPAKKVVPKKAAKKASPKKATPKKAVKKAPAKKAKQASAS